MFDRLVYLSCLNNNVSTLNYLIKKFNISPKSPSLRIAVYFGYLDIVHYLIQHNEDLLFKNPDIFDFAFEKTNSYFGILFKR